MEITERVGMTQYDHHLHLNQCSKHKCLYWNEKPEKNRE